MSEPGRAGWPRRNPLAATAFSFVCLLLSPAIVVGYIMWAGKAMLQRQSGASATAQGPLSARWFQHQLGIRCDDPAHRLLMVLPGVSPLTVWLVFGPMLLAYRLSGYIPAAFRYPFSGDVSLGNQAAARQTFYDGVVEQYLTTVEQFVILGAGFDTRALRLPKETQRRVRCFEVDTPKTMAVKRETLRRAGIDANGVALVSADFEQEDWLARIIDAGFDPRKPALFMMEGVAPYLDRAAIEDTLRKIAATAPGSVMSFDFFTTEVLQSNALRMKLLRASLQAAGEPLKFGIDSTPPSRDRLADLLRRCGLTLVEHRPVGTETANARALGGFATAIVPSTSSFDRAAL